MRVGVDMSLGPGIISMVRAMCITNKTPAFFNLCYISVHFNNFQFTFLTTTKNDSCLFTFQINNKKLILQLCERLKLTLLRFHLVQKMALVSVVFKVLLFPVPAVYNITVAMQKLKRHSGPNYLKIPAS